MKHVYRVLCAATASAMLLTLSACNETPAGLDVTVPPADDGNTTTTVATTAPAPISENIITGVSDMNETTLQRPVGVMIANNDFIQSEQIGLGAADMWVEAETEGGITRMMAVFANTERVPAAIGPVRSARTPFVKVAQALGLGYVHAGGSYTALDYLASSDTADLDVNAGESGGTYSWRDNEYTHDYEYRLRTSGEKLTKYLADRGDSIVPTREIPWTFGEQSGESATDVSVMMSGAQTIGFTYNSETGVYTKTNGSSKTPHADSSGMQICPTTVLVLYTDQYWENDTTIDFYLQSGEGYVFSKGVMRRFDWTRSADGFTMNEKDGSTLTIGEGKVYLCVVSAGYESEISYQ